MWGTWLASAPCLHAPLAATMLIEHPMMSVGHRFYKRRRLMPPVANDTLWQQFSRDLARIRPRFGENSRDLYAWLRLASSDAVCAKRCPTHDVGLSKQGARASSGARGLLLVELFLDQRFACRGASTVLAACLLLGFLVGGATHSWWLAACLDLALRSLVPQL